jgi:taurine dioxygenase
MPRSKIIVQELPVGAELIGLEPGLALDAEVCTQLRQAWLHYGFLLFHDVDSVERHLELSEVFGELEMHPMVPTRSALHPLLVDVGGKNAVKAFVFDNDGIPRANRLGWHRDTVFTRDICQGSMLRMVDVTTVEGETMLADTAKAYDDLPPALKARLEGLEYRALLRDPILGAGPGAFWKSARPATEGESPKAIVHGATHKKSDFNFPPVLHPVVMRHPGSGRTCLYLSPSHFDCIVGLEKAESDDLRDRLVDHMLNEKYTYRHKWRTNDAILWDNWRMIHAAYGHPLGEVRWGLRTTLAARLRSGRYEDGVSTRNADTESGMVVD